MSDRPCSFYPNFPQRMPKVPLACHGIVRSSVYVCVCGEFTAKRLLRRLLLPHRMCEMQGPLFYLPKAAHYIAVRRDQFLKNRLLCWSRSNTENKSTPADRLPAMWGAPASQTREPTVFMLDRAISVHERQCTQLNHARIASLTISMSPRPVVGEYARKLLTGFLDGAIGVTRACLRGRKQHQNQHV